MGFGASDRPDINFDRKFLVRGESAIYNNGWIPRDGNRLTFAFRTGRGNQPHIYPAALQPASEGKQGFDAHILLLDALARAPGTRERLEMETETFNGSHTQQQALVIHDNSLVTRSGNGKEFGPEGSRARATIHTHTHTHTYTHIYIYIYTLGYSFSSSGESVQVPVRETRRPKRTALVRIPRRWTLLPSLFIYLGPEFEATPADPDRSNDSDEPLGAGEGSPGGQSDLGGRA